MTNKAKLKQQIEEMEAKLQEMRKELESAEKWEPEGGKYYINGSGSVCKEVSTTGYRKFGIERKTREAAEKARDEMRVFNRLLAYRDEFAPGYEPDWDSDRELKAYIEYDHTKNKWRVNFNTRRSEVVNVYMPEDVVLELARKLNSGEVEL